MSYVEKWFLKEDAEGIVRASVDGLRNAETATPASIWRITWIPYLSNKVGIVIA
jgi:hypothetical protein